MELIIKGNVKEITDFLESPQSQAKLGALGHFGAAEVVASAKWAAEQGINEDTIRAMLAK